MNATRAHPPAPSPGARPPAPPAAAGPCVRPTEERPPTRRAGGAGSPGGSLRPLVFLVGLILASACERELPHEPAPPPVSTAAAADNEAEAARACLPGGRSPCRAPVTLAAGDYHTCGIQVLGQAYCWGENIYGTLGDGTTTRRQSPTPVAGDLRFREAATGRVHTCGLGQRGQAYCWGDNTRGQLGDGSTDEALQPNAVSGDIRFVSLAAGRAAVDRLGVVLGPHTCGVDAEGVAYCWGENLFGQLGDGTESTRHVPTPVAGGLRFALVTVGYLHSCGLTTSGLAYCWGSNSSGQLGDGTTTVERHVPTPVSTELRFRTITAGHHTTCAIAVDGAGWCWGDGSSGQLGHGSVVDYSTVPVQVARVPAFVALEVGADFVCGLDEAGSGWCWGDNQYGQVGDGTQSHRHTPAPVAGGLTFRRITAGGYHACGVTTDGAAYCWGSNSVGQLGDGTGGGVALAPVPVAGGLRFR